MKKIIAFSLWGDHPKYWVGARRNVELAQKFYPTWTPRFYIDSNAPKDKIAELVSLSSPIEIKFIDSKGPYHGMFWRFEPAFEPDVDIFISRDCDSRISIREVLAVNEWLNSDKDVHTMRDHPHHNMPIQGGMWGARNHILSKLGIKEKLEQWRDYSKWGVDQEFLKQVYPIIKPHAFEHCSFNIPRCLFGNEIHSFPTERDNGHFVGEVFTEDERRGPEYTIITNYHGQYDKGG